MFAAINSSVRLVSDIRGKCFGSLILSQLALARSWPPFPASFVCSYLLTPTSLGLGKQ